jgi:aldose 1-epimerase
VDINKKLFGLLFNGEEVDLYILKAGDLTITLSCLGASWTSLTVPSKKSGREDILLGYSTLEGYSHNKPHFGATIGRFANRIGGGRFALNGREYRLTKNSGENCIHGGRRSFDRHIWKAFPFKDDEGVYVRFEIESPDGDEGFPGRASVDVTYGITRANILSAEYHAALDAPCPVNLTNHVYFNLAGEGKGDVLSHEALIHARRVLERDASGLPTGKLLPVADGPFDFGAFKPIGRDIVLTGAGYDHCFVINGEPGELRPCAEVREESSGRVMRLQATQPGVQFYTANYLSGVIGKGVSVYDKHAGFCLETEHFPNSPNQPEFPSCIAGPGRDYHEKALFAFDVL